VLIQGSTVTTYVPLGSWGEPFTGIHVVTIEPATASLGTVATAAAVNSCSSCSSAACGGGVTVCTGNSNDVYVITPPTTVSATPTANATASQLFSGGACLTCGVGIDAATGKAWIAEGKSGGGGQLEPLTPPSTFGPAIGLFGQDTSENVSIDPIRSLILSANEGGAFQLINTTTGNVYNTTATFPTFMDSTAEDCSTGIALAPIEFTQKVAFANLTGATLSGGVPGVSPGTWSAPTNVQDFSPDFSNLAAGNSGSAVAPGSHLAVIAGEFGGVGFGVLQLQTVVTPTTIPAATDWVSANVPDIPTTPPTPWTMGLDPHTVTAYVSPNNGKAYALMTNIERTYLVKVDMALLLSAPRLLGTHTANPLTIPAGTFTFIAQ